MRFGWGNWGLVINLSQPAPINRLSTGVRLSSSSIAILANTWLRVGCHIASQHDWKGLGPAMPGSDPNHFITANLLRE
jgi:hypothetical protein